MWLQACLNGNRTSAEHSKVPLTPSALALAASRGLDAGVDELHVHPRDASGHETLIAEHVAASLTAIRKACPGVAIGISTAADIEPDITRRLAAITSWAVLPDYVSVNLAEPHIEHVIAILLERGVGLEAGISASEDARALLTLMDVSWLRLLLEPQEIDPVCANAAVDAIEKTLGDALPHVPRLLHGTDEAAWSLLKRAARSGYVSRVGLEDTLLLPTGDLAPDNVALIQAAKELI